MVKTLSLIVKILKVILIQVNRDKNNYKIIQNPNTNNKMTRTYLRKQRHYL